MTDTIKAAHLVRYGFADGKVLLAEEPDPGHPSPGEALVGVRYAPINLNDLMVVWGIYPWHPKPPIAIGNEGAGTVIAVGSGVTNVAPGDAVVLPMMARSWRQRLRVPADLLVPLPANADLKQASMLAINAATAVMLLDDYVALAPGEAVVFNAATSGLGRWLAALTQRRQLRAIGLVRRPEDVAPLKQVHPELELIVDAEDAKEARARLGDLPVRLALDGVGSVSSGRLAQLLSPGGKLVAYGAASRQPMSIPSSELIFRRITVDGFWEGHPENTARVSEILRGLVGLIGPEGIQQPVAAVYPIDAVEEAVAHAMSGGKVLLDMEADSSRRPTLEERFS